MNCNKHVDKPLQNKIKTLELLELQVKAIRWLDFLPPESGWMYKIYIAILSVCLFNGTL
jgi:hypothetical protein